MKPLKVRDMLRSDIERVLEIERESFESPWTEEFFLQQLGLREAAVNLVITSSGEVVGYVMMWLEGGNSHILNLAVDPGFRGGRAAALLLESVLERSRGAGCRVVYLEVRESNAKALRFYRKNGFVVAGKLKKYYLDSGEDALVLFRDTES